MEEEAKQPVKVSVLIVSFNNAAALRRCLASLERSKNREAMEIIVVDNGSRDESPQLDSEFPGATFLRLPHNFGLTKALNIGVRTSVAEYIFFLHADTEVLPETVSALAGKLDAQADAVAVCPLLVTPGGEAESSVRRLPDAGSLYSEWRNGQPAEGAGVDRTEETVPVEYPEAAAMMARGYFVKGMRYFDERYGEFGAHEELCYQIQRASKKTLIFPSIAVVHYGDHLPFDKLPSGARGLLSADRALGSAVYVSKHCGFLAGLKFRLTCIFTSLLSLQFACLSRLIGGQKIDGTQRDL
jgi:GT2 family glycosyltransferase